MPAKDPGIMPAWQYYESAAGADGVRGEVTNLKMSPKAALAWNRLLILIELGDARAGAHFTPLKGKENRGLREVVLERDGCWYRMFYSHEASDPAVILAVRAFKKKSNKTPLTELEVARVRRRDWRLRNLGV